jgi:lysyl-tRNA synthetase, class I
MTEALKFWADEIAQDILKKSAKLVVNTGITPSGEIHIGNLRETLTADTIYRTLIESKAQVEFNWVADSYDPLRKVYPFLDEKVFEQFVGQPLSDIPCPCGKHASYSDHFLEPFFEALVILGIKLNIKKNDELYKKGLFNSNVITALKNTKRIAQILNEETGKEVEDNWSPFNPVCEKCKRITKSTVEGFSEKNETIDYKCECGFEGTRKITGGGKLTWRVDWPARWNVLGVTVEPFGKDHASKGGSYDTGKKISEEIFKYPAPYPIVYEWISLKGMGDMSSSKGNVISARKMLEVLPPEVLRYSIIKVKPNRSITFDPGLPIVTLMDEFDDAQSKNRNQRAYEISMIQGFPPIGVPFRHIVSLVQIARDNVERMAEILSQNGYEIKDMQALKSRAVYARKWLDNFAPDDVKFTVKECLPDSVKNLTDLQKKALAEIASALKSKMNGDEIGQIIYDIKDKLAIDIKDIFKAIYISLLDKESGPRAGMFLAMLDSDFIKKRFTEASSR